MINVSSEFRRALYDSNKKFLAIVNITLADGTTLVVENDKIMENGIQFEDAVGSDDSFSALGGAVINGLTLVLNNIYEDFSDYDFTDAKITRTRIGLQLSQNIEYVDKGTYTVEDAIYNGATITLSCLDNMHKFDVPYSNSSRTYPASLDLIVRDICTVCGVNLATSSLNFPRKNFEIATRPTDEAITCREVLSWCATIAGCFARCNVAGNLELKWFDTSLFDDAADDLDGGSFDTENQNSYTTGDTADGGSFNPWNTGYVADGGSFAFGDLHVISSLYSQNIAVDDVIITQVVAEVKSDSDTGESIVTYTEGQPGYAIKISGNDFLDTTNAQDIVTYLGQQLIGLRFRKATVSHLSDPTIEAGDCGVLYDRKNNRYELLITRTNFSVSSPQTTVCGAETPARNSVTRFTSTTKSYVELRKKLLQQKSTWEQAEEDLIDRINNANGLYSTDVVQQDQSVIHYLHNKPLLNESDIRIMVSNVGITVTANGTSQSPTWYGLTVDGQFIASILNTIGVNADWIRSGTLLLGGTSSDAGLLEVYNANGVKIGEWSKNGAQITGQLTLDSDAVTATIGNMINFTYWSFDGILNRLFNGNGLRIKTKEHPKYSMYISPNRILGYIKEDTGSSNSVQYKLINHQGENIYYVESGNKLYRYIEAHGDAFGMVAGEYTFDSAFPDDDTDAQRSISNSKKIEMYIGYKGLAIGSGLTNVFGTTDYYITDNWGVTRNGYSQYGREQVSYGVFVDYRGAEIILGGSGSTAALFNAHRLVYTTSGLVVNGNTVAYQSTSARRYKNNIELLHNTELDPHRLYNLKVKQFRYNVDVFLQYKDMYGQTLPGFIAEDVAEIYPAAVIHNVENPDDIESWDERRIIPPMLSLIQEQHEQIEELTERVNQLERLVNQLLEERTNA